MMPKPSLSSLCYETRRFGTITPAPERIVEFVQPILGFDDCKRFALLDHDEDSPFNWLQSLDNPDLAFVITNPTLFGIPYEVTIPSEAVNLLNITKAEDTIIFTLVTIPPDDPASMTANLLGPVVMNQYTQQAMQVILNNQSEQYSTKTPLLAHLTLDTVDALEEPATVTTKTVTAKESASLKQCGPSPKRVGKASKVSRQEKIAVVGTMASATATPKQATKKPSTR
jgi:flagellar assembly factor FliW